MKKFILAGCLLSCMSVMAIANECQSKGFHSGDAYYGKTTCDNVNVANLSIYGYTSLTSTKVGDLTVHGDVDGKDVTVSDAYNLHGNSDIDQLIVNGKSTVFGYLHLVKGSMGTIDLMGNLYATGTLFNGMIKMRMTHSMLINAIVKKSIWIETVDPEHEQILCLEGKTTVKGNISFASGHGKVYQSKQTKIQGKVTGATVLKATCPAHLFS